MLRTARLPIIRSFSLYAQQWYMSYILRANVYDIYHCCVYSEKLLNDGQRNCPKHVEFYSKNKFEKLVHLVGFIIRTCYYSSHTKQLCVYRSAMYIWSFQYSKVAIILIFWQLFPHNKFTNTNVHTWFQLRCLYKFHCNSSPQWTDICQYWHNTNAILCCQSLEDRVCGCVAMNNRGQFQHLWHLCPENFILKHSHLL